MQPEENIRIRMKRLRERVARLSTKRMVQKLDRGG